MLDISFGELAIIFTLCLLVLGPEKLPKLASQLGRLAGQARAMARHFRTQLEQEVQHDQMMKELRESDAALSKALAQARENPIEALASLGTSADESPKPADAKSADDKALTATGPADQFQHDDPDFDPSGAIGREAANAAAQTTSQVTADPAPISKPAA